MNIIGTDVNKEEVFTYFHPILEYFRYRHLFYGFRIISIKQFEFYRVLGLGRGWIA